MAVIVSVRVFEWSEFTILHINIDWSENWPSNSNIVSIYKVATSILPVKPSWLQAKEEKKLHQPSPSIYFTYH